MNGRHHRNGNGHGLGQTETKPAVLSYLRVSTHKKDVPGEAPVSGASVKIIGPDDKEWNAAAKNGEARFSLPYPVGTPVVISVTAPGYRQNMVAVKTFDEPSRGHTLEMETQTECYTVLTIVGVGLAVLIGSAFICKRA